MCLLWWNYCLAIFSNQGGEFGTKPGENPVKTFVSEMYHFLIKRTMVNQEK